MFKLHSVQLELEAVERQIHELLGKQAQLREWRATLETSWADAQKSGVSMQHAANTPTTPTTCVSLHRPHATGTRSSQMSFTPAPGNHGPWVQQRKTRSRPRATTPQSGPLPSYRRGHERFSRLFALNEWLLSWCKNEKLLCVNNWNLFWERPRLFRADGLHPSRVGAELLSDNITRTLRSIWLVSQFSNICYDNFCSTLKW